MRSIDEYLRLQEETNKEIRLILLDLETVERKEKQLVYLENKQLIDIIDNNNIVMPGIVRNEFGIIKKRLGTITIIDDAKKLGLTSEISNLYQLVNNLETKLLNLEMKTNKSSEKSSNETISQEHSNDMKSLVIESKTKTNKTRANGLKLGVSALNLVGIILILISLTTFGRYVYVNFLSKEMKGVVLFLVPILILLAGELYFSKKNYKFSKGITALGISGLYTAVIINYLVLDNINGIVALVITAIITGGAIYLSYKKESNLLRIVTLVGAYICLVPIDKISIEQSYILVVILTIIHALNIYFPLQGIKNRDVNIPFEFYTSILALVSTLIIGVNLEKNVLVFLLIITTIVYSVQYVITCKAKENLLNTLGLLLYFAIYPLVTSVVYPLSEVGLFTRAYVPYLPLGVYCVIGLSILFTLKKASRWTGYTGFVLACTFIIINIAFQEYDSYVLCLALLTGGTLLLFIKDNNKILKYTLIGLVVISILGYFITIEEAISVIYLVLFAIILYGSKEFKNTLGVVVFKYFYMLSLVWWVQSMIAHTESLYDIEVYVVFISLVICIIYTTIINKVDRLRHDTIKSMNYVSLCLIVVVGLLAGLIGTTEFYLSIVITVYILVSMLTEDYIDNRRISHNKTLIYAFLSTYIVVRLSFIVDIVYEVKQLMLSISLMIVALGSVFIGFKLNNPKLRKYGLILSLITCVKLMLVDFYSFDFIIKTLVFLVVGIIALIISYTFSKLENEYKNK